MMGVENEDVHQSASGWSPVYAHENLGVMSIGFMLGSKNDAVIWRGPRKNGLFGVLCVVGFVGFVGFELFFVFLSCDGWTGFHCVQVLIF